MAATWDFLVGKTDLGRTERREGPSAEAIPLADGEALLEVERFALTANNITYGAMGESFGYWRFFPAPEGWGRIPVWGFARVVRSNAPDVAVGTRVFGYLPMSTELVVEPARAGERGFLDGAAHRRDVMATVWNHYQPVAHGSARADAVRSLLRPLFITGFLIEDFLDDHDAFGADVVVITSASAKTAIAAAHELRARGTRRVVGLTAPAHVAVVEALGAYDEVRPYGEADQVAGERAVLIDIAGRLDARDAVHARFGDALGHSMTVGLSNVPEASRLLAPPPATGPAPEVFYAQLQVAKRADEWGQAVFDERLEAAWERFVAFTEGWLRIDEVRGPEAVADAWRRLVAGEIDPLAGLQLSLRSTSSP